MPTQLPNQKGPVDAYATDEDCVVASGADFAVIAPPSNLMAKGIDGVFQASDLWTLTTTSNDFVAQGVQVGMVVQLSKPTPQFTRPQLLAVQAVASGSLLLRRVGLAAGVGLPPAPAGGLIGVAFTIVTLNPQLENAAYFLNERFNINKSVERRTDLDIYDSRTLQQVSVWRVYWLQYMGINRDAKGDFADKQLFYKILLSEGIDACVLRWGSVGTTQPSTTIGSMRLTR